MYIFIIKGVHEVYLSTLYKAILIEFIGTATFVFIHIAIVKASINYSYPPLLIGIKYIFLPIEI